MNNSIKTRFHITWPNGDSRGTYFSKDEVLSQLRFMRSKWAGLMCDVNMLILHDSTGLHYTSKTKRIVL